MTTYPNDTAFPLKNEPNFDDYPGLTKREYFAAMALQGILANDFFQDSEPKLLSKKAVEAADYLIEALNHPTSS